MRILYLTRDYTTHDHRFLSTLAETEHEVFYLRLENKGHRLESRTFPDKVHKFDWAGGKSNFKPMHLPGLLLSLRKVIKKIKPDLIHAGPIQSAALLAVLSGFKPVVTMSWAYDLLFDADKNLFNRWATKKTLEKSDLLIADCEMIANLAVKKGFSKERIVIFPWGIDLNKFSPAEDKKIREKFGWKKDEFVLLHNRAWEPLYGVDVFAKAFVIAARRHPELRLLLLGQGSLSPKLEKIFKQSSEIDKVRLPGVINQDRLPAFYRNADLYISASHSDGSSVSMMEALACGKPVLLSDIPGNEEWITPGEQGWLFKDGDVQSLADGISHAVEHRKELKKVGIQARKLAEEKADWPKNFNKLLAAYELAKGLYV